MMVTIAFAAITIVPNALVVGHLTDVRELGLYALAFSLGFALLRQISWHVGALLFASIAATTDPASVKRRTLTRRPPRPPC